MQIVKSKAFAIDFRLNSFIVFIKIFDGDALVAELKIENVKINREISKKEFEL